MTENTPMVSVVLVVGERRHRSELALQSVLEQEGFKQAEIILIDAAPGLPPLPSSDHHQVKSHHAQIEIGFGGLKAMGARQASAPIIAFLEDHVEARSGWLMGILQAAEKDWSALGAEVHNANPGVGLGDVLGLINYGLWAPPLEKGEATILAGNNTIYRRQVLDQFGDQLDSLLASDTVLQMLLNKDGHRMMVDPAVSFRHRNPTTLWNGIQAEFLYHWVFGAIRARVMEWSRLKRAAYLLGTPAIPWLRFRRMLKPIRTRFGFPLGRFWLALAVTLLLMHVSAAAQAGGILFGVGQMEAGFTKFELNSRRPLAGEVDP